METKIIEIAQRIKGLREIEEISVSDMAKALGITIEEYLACENGENDFNFTFLYKCAEFLGVDIVEILTGELPRLSFYSIIRKDEGLDINRREGFVYEHLNFRFRGKESETFLVTAPYREKEQSEPVHMSTHEGQEFDYILSGTLEIFFEGHREVLNAGDAVYYDSGREHGMRAIGGEDCRLLAVVLRKKEG